MGKPKRTENEHSDQRHISPRSDGAQPHTIIFGSLRRADHGNRYASPWTTERSLAHSGGVLWRFNSVDTRDGCRLRNRMSERHRPAGCDRNYRARSRAQWTCGLAVCRQTDRLEWRVDTLVRVPSMIESKSIGRSRSAETNDRPFLQALLSLQRICLNVEFCFVGRFVLEGSRCTGETVHSSFTDRPSLTRRSDDSDAAFGLS